MRISLGLFFLLSFSLVQAKPLSELESEIVTQVNSGLAQSLLDLEQVVNINSGTMNFDGVRAVGKIFASQFDQMGFDTEWIEGKAFSRAGHLVATRIAEHPLAKRVLLIGHLDTVFSELDAFQKYAPLDERFVAGPGITDMKGGNVIVVSALRALKASNALDRLSIKVVFTGDEESSGRPLTESKRALIDAAKWADVALGFEDGDSDIKTAVIARRGSVNWSLEVSGKPAHSSQIFQANVGAGAILEAARILNSFREELSGQGDLTFNPGLIVGGTSISSENKPATKTAFGKNNVIAQTVEISGGLRALTLNELQYAKETMHRIVASNLPHTSANLKIEEGYPPLSPSEGNLKLLSMYSNVSQALGYGDVVAVNPRNAGAADISFTAGHVEMALDGLGLMGRGGHTRDEVADMTSLAQNAAKAAILMHRLSRE